MKDKRRFQRLNRQGKVYIEVSARGASGDEPGEVISCDCIDASLRGLRVSMDRPVRVGAIFHIGAELAELDDTLYLAAEVKWCRPMDTSTNYCVGFELYQASDSDIDAWQALVEQLQL